MGQCYSVYTKLKFKDNDPSQFCKVIADEFDKRNWYKETPGLKLRDLKDPFECFKVLTFDHAEEDSFGEWSADFDASYSWESIMIDIFVKALKVLEDGSYVEIYPDNGKIRIFVKNDIVYFEF